MGGPAVSVNGVTGFLLEVDGQRLVLMPGEILTLRHGSNLAMVDIESNWILPKGTVMNLRGFVGRPGDTTGNDKGTVADTSKNMIARFAMDMNGRRVFQLGA